jgi:ubiquinone/menaquinone biosynthesis C-methylase UbiE
VSRSHHDLIRDQFTRQAEAFSTAPAILDQEALDLLVRLSGAGPGDEVLDVACGPGIVACAFARAARRVAGIDLTGAMIDRARALGAERGLTNVEFRVGDVLPLPFPDGSFSVALSRYSFHHFTDPEAVFTQMLRVVRPGGKVVVADVLASPDPRRAANFNVMERLRDPSHVQALSLSELEDLYARAGLPPPRTAFYRLESDLEGLLARSFPVPGGAEQIRRLFQESLPDDGLGMDTRLVDGAIHAAYPIVVLASKKVR